MSWHWYYLKQYTANYVVLIYTYACAPYSGPTRSRGWCSGQFGNLARHSWGTVRAQLGHSWGIVEAQNLKPSGTVGGQLGHS